MIPQLWIIPKTKVQSAAKHEETAEERGLE